MWLFVLPVLYFLLAALTHAGLLWLAMIPWRRSVAVHWTERARLLWPARKTASFGFFLIPLLIGLAQTLAAPWLPLKYGSVGIAGFLGAMLGCWPAAKAMNPDARFGAWVRENVAVLTLNVVWLFAFLGGILAMPPKWGWQCAGLAAGVVLFQLWFLYGGALWLLKASGVVVEAPGELRELSGAMAGRLGIRPPAVGMLRGLMANAFAMPLLNTLVVTERTLALLSKEELSTVLAHEFGHLCESRRVVLIRVFGAFLLFPMLFVRPAVHTWGAAGALGLGAICLVASRAIGAFRRRMEVRADAVALKETSGEAYSRALERLYEFNQVPAVMAGKRHAHPNLYDRLLAAGVTPSYARPKPPAACSWHGILLVLAAAILGFWVLEAHRPGREAQWTEVDEVE